MIRTRLALATVLWGVLALAACVTTRRVHLRPVENVGPYDTGRPPYVQYTIEEGDTALRVQIDSAGLLTREDDPPETLAGFVFRVRNETGSPVIFPVPSFTLTDDEQHAFRRPYLDEQGDRQSAPVAVGPGERGAFTVVFDVTGKTRPERVGALVLSWSVRLGDREHAYETKFVRFEVRPRPVADLYYYGIPYPRPYVYRHSRLDPAGRLVWVPYEPDYCDPFFDDPWFWDN